MLGTSPVIVAAELLAASIWIGGMLCIAVVFRVARSTLEVSAQVALFRSVGRRYGVVGTAGRCWWQSSQDWDFRGRRHRGPVWPSPRSHLREFSW